MASKDYYSILGVDRNATKEEISKAYRKAALKYHPDRQQGKSESEKKDAEERFKECSEAASVLTDDEKRANYDRFGTAEPSAGMGGGGFDPFSFFRRFGGFGGGPFSDFGFDPFGFGSGQEDRPRYDPNAPVDGEDIAIKVRVEFHAAIYGGTIELNLDVDDPCPDCSGTGAKEGKVKSCHVCNGTGMETFRHGIMITSTTCRSCHGTGTEPGETCPKCRGTGSIKSERNIRVAVPMGLPPEGRLIVKGEGRKGLNGGKNGDVVITVSISESSPYGRDGLDLRTMVPISPITATLGGKVNVETPWGTEKISIHPGTASGTKFRVNGHGVRSSSGNGDLIVTVLVSPLVGLSSKQENALREIEKTISPSNVKSLPESDSMKRDFRRYSK